MNKDKLVEILKKQGFLEIELANNKALYIHERAGRYRTELDVWDPKTDDWDLVHNFEPVDDADELIDMLMKLFKL